MTDVEEKEENSEVLNKNPKSKRSAPWHVGVCLKPNRDKTVIVWDPIRDVSDLHRGN